MPDFFARSPVTSLVLYAVLVLVPALVQTQRGTGSADARLRALYTEEWNWRQQELAGGGDPPGGSDPRDRFPRVDAATQQARLAYWTRTLSAQDSIPFDELSPGELRHDKTTNASRATVMPRFPPRERYNPASVTRRIYLETAACCSADSLPPWCSPWPSPRRWRGRTQAPSSPPRPSRWAWTR